MTLLYILSAIGILFLISKGLDNLEEAGRTWFFSIRSFSDAIASTTRQRRNP